MIIDALLAAEPYMKLAGQVDKPDEYVYLTDDIMPAIEKTKVPVSAVFHALFCQSELTLVVPSASRNLKNPAQYSTVSAGVTCIEWLITRSSNGNIVNAVANISPRSVLPTLP
jgi:hypothetical protein